MWRVLGLEVRTDDSLRQLFTTGDYAWSLTYRKPHFEIVGRPHVGLLVVYGSASNDRRRDQAGERSHGHALEVLERQLVGRELVDQVELEAYASQCEESACEPAGLYDGDRDVMVLAVLVGAKDGLQPLKVEEGEFSKVKHELGGVCDVEPVERGHHLPQVLLYGHPAHRSSLRPAAGLKSGGS